MVERQRERDSSKLIYTKATAQCHASFRVKVVSSSGQRQQRSYLV